MAQVSPHALPFTPFFDTIYAFVFDDLPLGAVSAHFSSCTEGPPFLKRSLQGKSVESLQASFAKARDTAQRADLAHGNIAAECVRGRRRAGPLPQVRDLNWFCVLAHDFGAVHVCGVSRFGLSVVFRPVGLHTLQECDLFSCYSLLLLLLLLLLLVPMPLLLLLLLLLLTRTNDRYEKKVAEQKAKEVH
jgi:hypothetical protein